MFEVDNLGRGNCMYYAYSISLIYFLRAPKNSSLAPKIFDRLKLDDTDKITLLKILRENSSNLNQLISNNHLIIIQDILGKACRNFAAQSVYDQFKTSPTQSAIFTTASFQFRNYLALLSPKFKKYIPDTQLIDNHGNYTQAELFKTPGIIEGIQKYVEDNISALEQKFEDKLQHQLNTNPPKAIIFDKFIQKPINTFFINQTSVSPLALEFKKKVKQIILDQLIAESVQAFFLDNQEEFLLRYVQHLATDFVWGTEENLVLMNSALRGERAIRKDDGKVYFESDCDLVMTMYINGNATYHNTFAKLRLEKDPFQIPFSEILKLLNNRPGYILYDNNLYYVGIEDTRLLIKVPLERDIREHQQINWQSGNSCSAQELEILSQVIKPRPKDIHYLEENYYSIILNNKGNIHWTSMIPEDYLGQQYQWSLFRTGLAGIAIGEIIQLSLPNLVKAIQGFLGSSHLTAHLGMLAIVAVIFVTLAKIFNNLEYAPPDLCSSFLAV